MHISKKFVLREIAGERVIIPVGNTAQDFNGLLHVNESGEFIWKQLQNDISEEDLLKAILDEFEVDHDTAERDMRAFLSVLQSQGWLENE